MEGVLSSDPLRRLNVSATPPRGRETVGPRLSWCDCLAAPPPDPSTGKMGRLAVSFNGSTFPLDDVSLSREFPPEEGKPESPPPMEENIELVRSPRPIELSPLLEVGLLATRGTELEDPGPPGRAVLLTARGTGADTLAVGLPTPLKYGADTEELRPLEVGLLMVWVEDPCTPDLEMGL